MTADYRAELQHLLTAVENDVIDTNDGLRFQAAANRARAALAQPEPEGPTDKALASFTAYFCRNYPGPDTIIHKPEWHAPKIFRAAADALARFGRPAIEPLPLDVPQSLARDWINRHGTFHAASTGGQPQRIGTDWGMVIIEAARWGQRQGWDARPEQPAPAADVAPLLWVLWHHMGGNSPVGQPIRKYLGMGQFERMSKEQVEAAKGWGSIPFQVAPANTIAECGGPCEEDFRLCDCGLLQQLNPQRAPNYSARGSESPLSEFSDGGVPLG
jgi:hypothetical protein